jgi:tRNA (adenine57-N1/adenine58-N1)-methyltransferase catalytic subunit
MSVSSDDSRIKPGDRVLLYLDSRRTWLVQANENSPDFHTHAGIVELKSVIGKKFGDSVLTTMNEPIRLLKPTVIDFIMKSERRTQIVYPKDFSYIATRSGIRSGSSVLECGTGSGALTTFFASIVAPTGYVRTFEERDDFFTIAARNIAKAGMSKYVKMDKENLKDATSLEDSAYDLVVLDTGDPWLLLDKAHGALKGSGFVFCICPTTNQLENVAVAMEGKFVDIESIEIMFRRIEARLGKTRPSMRMIGHTCYLASARKANSEN